MTTMNTDDSQPAPDAPQPPAPGDDRTELTQLLADDPETIAFFDALISSVDKKIGPRRRHQERCS